MPRLARAQKDARKAKADALKASEASTTGNNNDNTISTSNSAPCSTNPHLVSNGGETRVLTAEERKQETATNSNASEVVQDKRPEKSGAVIGKESSDGGERGPGESKQENVTKINASEVVQDKRPEKSGAVIGKERSDGGERGPGESKQGGQHGYYENRCSGRGGSNEGDSRRIDALGRALSGILRHKAPELGLKVRSDGYVLVKDLLSLSIKTTAGLPLHAHSVDDLKEAVKRDNKQRFGLREENGQLLIRANQGHSLENIKSEDLLKPVLSAEEVPVCIHGTYKAHLESIKKNSLNRMSRNHVHFAAGQFNKDGVISGRHEDIFEPVAQLRAEESQRGAVEERLHHENFELRVEVARLGGIIEGMEMMRNSRSHS